MFLDHWRHKVNDSDHVTEAVASLTGFVVWWIHMKVWMVPSGSPSIHSAERFASSLTLSVLQSSPLQLNVDRFQGKQNTWCGRGCIMLFSEYRSVLNGFPLRPGGKFRFRLIIAPNGVSAARRSSGGWIIEHVTHRGAWRLTGLSTFSRGRA